MTGTALNGTWFADPIASLLARTGPSVLTLVSQVEGPSYRPLGAAMTVFGEKDRVGTLSSGCIEDDISLHALAALEAGVPRKVRYGQGSPYIDIKLPCGGGLEIVLLPNPDRTVLAQLQQRRVAREATTLHVDLVNGALTLADNGATARRGNLLAVRYEPPLRFTVFGKGPEAHTFAALAQAAGYPNLLLSPDEETLQWGEAAGCTVRHLPKPGFPQDLSVDHRTAVVLFFHDHEWEPAILAHALRTNALYIGAQGSRAARMTRDAALRDMGVDQAAIDSIEGPIGLIRSARDARTLAISVLAEVVDRLKDEQS